jgi:hypothetical protein
MQNACRDEKENSLVCAKLTSFKFSPPLNFLLPLYIFQISIVFIGLAYQGNDIVFRFIIEYNSLMDFGP